MFPVGFACGPLALFFFKQDFVVIVYDENGKVSPRFREKRQEFEFLNPEVDNYILISIFFTIVM